MSGFREVAVIPGGVGRAGMAMAGRTAGWGGVGRREGAGGERRVEKGSGLWDGGARGKGRAAEEWARQKTAGPRGRESGREREMGPERAAKEGSNRPEAVARRGSRLRCTPERGRGGDGGRPLPRREGSAAGGRHNRGDYSAFLRTSEGAVRPWTDVWGAGLAGGAVLRARGPRRGRPCRGTAPPALFGWASPQNGGGHRPFDNPADFAIMRHHCNWSTDVPVRLYVGRSWRAGNPVLGRHAPGHHRDVWASRLPLLCTSSHIPLHCRCHSSTTRPQTPHQRTVLFSSLRLNRSGEAKLVTIHLPATTPARLCRVRWGRLFQRAGCGNVGVARAIGGIATGARDRNFFWVVQG